MEDKITQLFANGDFQWIVPPYEAMYSDKKTHCSQVIHCDYIIIMKVENDPAQKSIIHHTTAAYNITITFHKKNCHEHQLKSTCTIF